MKILRLKYIIFSVFIIIFVYNCSSLISVDDNSLETKDIKGEWVKIDDSNYIVIVDDTMITLIDEDDTTIMKYYLFDNKYIAITYSKDLTDDSLEVLLKKGAIAREILLSSNKDTLFLKKSYSKYDKNTTTSTYNLIFNIGNVFESEEYFNFITSDSALYIEKTNFIIELADTSYCKFLSEGIVVFYKDDSKDVKNYIKTKSYILIEDEDTDEEKYIRRE